MKATKRFLLTLAAILGMTGAWAQDADEVAVTKTANNNEWTLTMPASNVELQVEYYMPFDLTLADGSNAHGTVAFTVGDAAATQALKDDVVTVSVTPAEGYSVKGVTAKTSSQVVVPMTNGENGWTFTMPEENVAVTVTYAKNLQDAWIQTIADQTYTGSAIEPTIEVKDGETTLVLNTDYTVAYSNNVEGGSQGVVTITGIGNYSGTVSKTFNVVAAVYSTANAAIDVNVPEGLGQLTPETTGQTTDLYYFLQSYLQNSPNPAYIKLRLASMGQYVISQPLTVLSAITIEGDAEGNATIDASHLGANPFVIIDRNHQVNEKNEKGFLTSIYNVEFKNFIVEKAEGSLFSSNGQKYDIPYMTIDNVVYEAKNSGKPLISLLGGGIVENLTMTRSTAYTSGYLYNGSGSAKLAEAGVNSQKFTFSYNTLVETYGLVHADDSESAKRTINVDHNVIMEPTANFVTSLNAGDANCIVQYNAFLSMPDIRDGVYNDISNAEDTNGAVGSIKGNMVWVNTDKLVEDLDDRVINFPMGDCPQRDAKIGDPRWLSAKMRIKEADVDDDNDLAKVINVGVKKGYTEFELVQNQYGNLRYTVKQSIVTDKAISITGENVQIDVESGDDFIKVANVAGDKAKKADGSDSNYTIVENITLKGLTINGLTKSLINNTSGNVVFTKISIDDDVIEFSGSSAVFALGNGYPEDLTITKSTLWSQAGHTGFLFQAQGRPKDATGSTSWTIEKSTLYQIAKGKKMNNNNSGIKGQKTTKMTLTESILFETGSNTGNEINGWLFGQNSASPVRTYNKNTYWAGNAEATGWTDSSKTGSDQTGTALTTDPGFKKPAEGDFTLSMYAAQLIEKTGDPRWFIEGGHVNPTAIETVKTAEETSLENAVIYNLNGQRVEKAQKGLYIVNGKKVIIK